MTPIQGIQPIWAVFPTEETQSDPAKGSEVFADIFQSAIDQVKQTDAEKNYAEYLLATGQLDNPAELTIASTKAQMSVELLVQLRSKALDAYNELMRISI